MICSDIGKLLGIECVTLNEKGTVALISSPFEFDDGDSIPIYIQTLDNYCKFFDDGEFLSYLLGRGLREFTEPHIIHVIDSLIKKYEVSLNNGLLEISGKSSQAPTIFSKYLSCLLDLADWVKEHISTDPNKIKVIERAELVLKAWRPEKDILIKPEFKGASGRYYKFDFSQNGEAILAISGNSNSVNSAIRKVLDVSRFNNQKLFTRVIVDTQGIDKNKSEQDLQILDAVANQVHTLKDFETMVYGKKSIH